MRYGFGNTFDRILPKLDSKPTWQSAFGANYYDHWRAWDADSLTLTGLQVDAALSLTGSGRSIVGTGGNRPTLINDPIIGKNCFGFDGTSDFMQVPSSAGLYNFLHDGAGGTVIVVFKQITTPSVVGVIVNNGFGTRGFRSQYNGTGSGVASGILGAAVHDGTSNIYNNNTAPTTYPLNKFHSMVSIYDVAQPIAANKGSIIVNNGTPSNNNTTSGTPSASNAASNFTVGTRTLIPRDFYLNANVAEILIFDKVFTPADILVANTILTNDYGSSFPIS